MCLHMYTAIVILLHLTHVICSVTIANAVYTVYIRILLVHTIVSEQITAFFYLFDFVDSSSTYDDTNNLKRLSYAYIRIYVYMYIIM